MTDSFIEVEPSGAANRVKVKTELLDEREIPVYITSHSDGTLIDEDNPAATSDALTLSAIQILTDCLTNSLKEQKLTNLYLSKVVGEDLRLDSETEVYP